MILRQIVARPPIDEKVCGSLGNRCSDAQVGTVSLRVTALASEITVNVEQGMPQPA